MSIWSSVPEQRHRLDAVPYRDDDSGRDAGQAFLVDVATATSWHDKIRVCFDDSCELLDRDEAAELAARLTRAVAAIDARP